MNLPSGCRVRPSARKATSPDDNEDNSSEVAATQLRQQNAELRAALDRAEARALHLEGELKQISAHFDLALRASSVTAWAVDSALRCTWIYNPILSLSVDERIGKRCGEYLPHSEDAERIEVVLRQAIEERQPQKARLTIHDEHRHAHVIDLLAQPLRDASGTVVGATGTLCDVTEQVRIERELREREERLQLALEGAQAGVWETDLERQMCWLDGRAQAIYELPEVVSVDERLERIHPDDKSLFLAASATAQNPTEPRDFELEHRVRGPQGSYRWLLVRGRAHFRGLGAHRRAVRVTGVVWDITARKQTAQRLQASEKRFRLALKHSPVAVFNQDRQLRYTWIYNLDRHRPKEEILGADDYARFPAEQAQRLEEIKRRVLRTGNPERQEIQLGAGEHAHWWDLWLEPIRDSQNRITGIAGAAVDLTAHKETELLLREHESELQLLTEQLEQRVAETTCALRESEARWRAFSEASFEGIAVMDEQGCILDANRRAQELAGQESLANVLGRPAWDFVPARHRDRVQRHVTSRYEDTYRAELQREDGTRLPVELRGRSTTFLGRAARVTVIRDITRQVITERAVRQLNRELALAEQRERARLSEVLHDDLQQILFGLKMHLGPLFRLLSKPDAQAAEQRDQILLDVQQMVEQAIEVTRTLSVELNPPVLREEGLTAALCWLAGHMEARYGLRVRLEADTAIGGLSEEQRSLIVNLVRELLFNVAKHAGVDEARVEAQVASGWLHLTVIDAGKGFDMEQAQTSSVSHRSLGLFRIRERLRLFGGHLQVTSTLGEGTCSTISLPSVFASELIQSTLELGSKDI